MLGRIQTVMTKIANSYIATHLHTKPIKTTITTEVLSCFCVSYDNLCQCVVKLTSAYLNVFYASHETYTYLVGGQVGGQADRWEGSVFRWVIVVNI